MLTSDALAEAWDRLDEFEGPAYERVLTQVTLSSGVLVDAWLYVDRNVAP